MSMYYIIQENVFKDYHYNILMETLERLGFPYTTVRIFPFVDKITDIKEIPYHFDTVDDLPDYEPPKDETVFCFGGVKLARVAANRKWHHGSLMNENHDFEVYKDFYKENLLNYDSIIVNYGDDYIWEDNEPRFIRPTKDNKTFSGKVFDKENWLSFKKDNYTEILRKDTQIQISPVKNIRKEIRFWCVGGKIVTGSIYKIGDRVVYDELYDESAKEFAQEMVDLYQIADAFVIDVCLMDDDSWKIVECNCINCAGFYKADMQKLIMSIEDYFNKS